jgi:putative ATP-grasp target RiPP
VTSIVHSKPSRRRTYLRIDDHAVPYGATLFTITIQGDDTALLRVTDDPAVEVTLPTADLVRALESGRPGAPVQLARGGFRHEVRIDRARVHVTEGHVFEILEFLGRDLSTMNTSAPVTGERPFGLTLAYPVAVEDIVDIPHTVLDPETQVAVDECLLPYAYQLTDGKTTCNSTTQTREDNQYSSDTSSDNDDDDDDDG